MVKNKKRVKTFIIIATMEIDSKESFKEMFLTEPREYIKQRLRQSDIIPLDRPMIVSPKGFKSLEVIPIDSETIIHGRGIKRRIVP